MSHPAAVAIDDASLQTREGTVLVSGLRLTVAPGSKWAVVGPNGAGKTSLVRLIAGAVRPSSGAVLIDGIPVTGLPLRERALRLAVVAQTDAPDLRIRLRDYVALGRIPHRGRVADAIHRAVVADALGRMGLDRHGDRPLGALSGGERQRGALARALAQEPGLLVLDEPTNHLDPRARADLLTLVRDLDMTVVAVLHDLALVGPFADAVAVLRGGRLVTQGPPPMALAPAVIRDVFGLTSFEAVNPATGRPVLVFDPPDPSSPTERTHVPLPIRGAGPAHLLPRRPGRRLSGDGG